jgi:hypothetical protein
LEDELRNRDVELELIFINDGSGDNSQTELLAIKARRLSTKIIKHARSAIGLAVANLGFLYGLYMSVGALLGTITVRGFTTIVVLLSFFAGMILVPLGIIGEYLWRIFEVVNKNIESVVEEALL